MDGKLEFWDEIKDFGHGKGINIKDPEYPNRGYVLSVLQKDGLFTFVEANDDVFNIKLNKDQALKLVDELKQWIESN